MYGWSLQELAWAAQAVHDTADTRINASVSIPVLLNDGDSLDVVFANDGQNRVCLGDGAGGFICSSLGADTDNSGKGALGDLNGDGILDVVFANRDGQPNRICLGDGAGGFTPCSNVGPDTSESFRNALGDFNGDGRLDVVFANSNQPNQICLGDGAGGFTSCGDVSSDTDDSRDLAVGDLNGDGNLDLAFANLGQPNRGCLGNGSGGFACNAVSPDADNSSDVALGDIDGDGLLDAVFANAGQANRVCLGDGAGGFTSCVNAGADISITTDVTLGDVNGDGNLDAVFANFGQSNQVCLGDGAGGFACSAVSADTRNSLDVVLADFNGDGNLDAVFSTSGQPNTICLGDGTGAFTSCSDIGSDMEPSQGVTAGFLGLDIGTLDITIPPSNGAAVLNADGTITYTPNSGFEGTDQFSYSIEGGTATVMINVTPTPAEPKSADLEVTLTNPGPVTVEQELSFTITVVNNGPHATRVSLVQHFWGENQLVSAAPSQGSCAEALNSRGTLSCDLGQMTADGAATVNVVVRPTCVGEIVSRVEAHSKFTDPFLRNNMTTQEVEAVTFLVIPRTLRGSAAGIDCGSEAVQSRGCASVSRLTGFAVNVSPQHISSLIAQPRTLTPRLAVPHFFVDAQGGGTTIRLLNVGLAEAEVTIRAFDHESSLLGSAQFTIEKDNLFVGDLQELLGLDMSVLPPLTSGYLPSPWRRISLRVWPF